jgi:hypothetical protein
VLARRGGLGVEVRAGRLGFAPSLLWRSEFLDEPIDAIVGGVSGPLPLALERGTLAFTFCQVPVVYRLVEAATPDVVERRGAVVRTAAGTFLDEATSREVFERTGAVSRIEVAVPTAALRSRDGGEPAPPGVDGGAIHARGRPDDAAAGARVGVRP